MKTQPCNPVAGGAMVRSLAAAALALGICAGSSAAVSIDAVYFGQTHVLKPDNPYFGLVSDRYALIKAHVVDPATPASPAVEAVLTLGGQTLNLPLTGPANLPASVPDGLGVVQHTYDDSFTAIIPAAWVQPGLDVTVNAGPASVTHNNLEIGAPTKVIMRMFDVHYFSYSPGDYPAGTFEEIEAKWPVAELEIRRLSQVVFPELVIPPRSGVAAARVTSQSDYLAQTGLGFDGEQAAALAWNGALKRAGGRSGRLYLSYINIYGVPAGGQAGGFSGVGSGTGYGIFHHELGHALSLPHWGNSSSYPYKGAMHGIPAPDNYNETHAGPAWAFDLPSQSFIPPIAQPNNVGGKPPGTYKVDPMQGGGTGYQEPGYLLNHFSDYSVNQMRNYLEGHVLVWNDSLGAYAGWNQGAADYTSTVTNNGVQYPIELDANVITVMASVSGAKPDVCMVYPPIGPYVGGRIKLFDPTVPADRAEAQSIFAPSNGCDVSLRIVQGGVEKTYMLAASWETWVDPLSGSSLKTEAVNLPAADGDVTRVDLLLTPDAEINGLPADPQVLYTWSPVTPDPATFDLAPTAGGATAITMRATTGVSTGDPVEYLFTETSGNPGGSSSGWQSSPSYSDIGLQPETTYSYTVTMRAGSYTGRPSAELSETTQATGSAGTITVDGSASWNSRTPPLAGQILNASGSDKLVVVATAEHGFNNTSGDVTQITYNGQNLTPAVERMPVMSEVDITYNSIWYLDDPGDYPGTGEILVYAINREIVTAIALSGTAPGVGATAIGSYPALSVDLTTTGDNSLVIAALGMGGDGNTGNTTGVDTVSPLTEISSPKDPSNWLGHVTGSRQVDSPSAVTYAFTGASSGMHAIAAEFIAAPLPPDYETWDALYPAADLSDPNGNFDGDALTNAEERIWGQDPTKGSSTNPYTSPLDTTAGSFTYTRRDADLTGLTYEIWTSTDMKTWNKDSTATQTPGTPDAFGVETVTVGLTGAPITAPRFFVRVSASG